MIIFWNIVNKLYRMSSSRSLLRLLLSMSRTRSDKILLCLSMIIVHTESLLQVRTPSSFSYKNNIQQRFYPATTTADSHFLQHQQDEVFSSQTYKKRKSRNMHHTTTVLYLSSFAADGSEYSGDNNNNDEDDADLDANLKAVANRYVDDDETPTIELSPVPMSKNSGNRFVVIVWDKDMYQFKQQLYQHNNNEKEEKDVLDLHYDHIALTEDHVMFCRKANLYNETFNSDSMVDILWSLPILSADLGRVIGHAMVLESTSLDHIKDFLSREPIIQMLTDGSTDFDDPNSLLSKVPLYRWRHIRDFSLRIDDGRFGYPCLCLALDGPIHEIDTIRQDIQNEHLEYMIRSERIIAAGPIHTPTESKDDPDSVAVGDFILFNAKDRNDAIDFIEQLPGSLNGLYDTIKVHFYNQLDVTGKFVSEDPLRDTPCDQMKEAMEVWGYPVHDDQTAWLNW